MTIDWTHFTPWTALLGGTIIGLAAALFIVMNGRILGISSIMGGLLRPRRGDIGWRIRFIAGMLVAPLVLGLFGQTFTSTIDASLPALIIAGLLVGVGTRYGGGCTSGHGVCGLSRLSVRSLVATLCFMVAGFTTVYLIRHT
jgi:uncharacterized protein